jgi:hypothetical protein
VLGFVWRAEGRVGALLVQTSKIWHHLTLVRENQNHQKAAEILFSLRFCSHFRAFWGYPRGG